MRSTSEFAEQAIAGSGPCALASSPVVFSVQRAFIVGAVDHSYLITLLCLRLTIPPYTPTMLVVLATRRAFASGGADLTCVRSAVRSLAPPVYSAGYLRPVGHVGGPAVRGCDDLTTRSAFVIS
ncbi:hypothetical protein BHE74_00016300 [Ensete ventricosum]|nr:hypothetical protein BHE74_00016300 [Ensete ventricosum]